MGHIELIPAGAQDLEIFARGGTEDLGVGCSLRQGRRRHLREGTQVVSLAGAVGANHAVDAHFSSSSMAMMSWSVRPRMPASAFNGSM